MLIVRMDDSRTIVVYNGHNVVDTGNAYLNAARQRDAGRIVSIADCWKHMQLDAVYTILFATYHWTTFLDYVASVLYPSAELQGDE